MIDDIVNLINTFGKTLETFDPDLIYSALQVDDGYETITNPEGSYQKSAFGKMIAVKGRIYHWTVKIDEDVYGRDPYINIGIFDANKAKNNLDGCWWKKEYGYSYFKSGTIWSYSSEINTKYGTRHKAGDIIEMWLDLKDKYTLSYAKNDKHFGVAFKIPSNTSYRFGLNVARGKVTIIAFEITF